MNIYEKILDIKEVYIYIVLAILLIFPLLSPIGLPLTIEDITQKYYKGIDALPPGTIVLAPHDASAGTEMEIGLSARTVIKHLFRKEGLKIVFACISSDGPPIFIKTLEDTGLWDQFIEGYGVKYVYLPYIPGNEAAAAALSASIRKTTGGLDYFGNNLDDLPMMQDIDSGGDFDVVVATNEHSNLALFWMNQLSIPNNIPIYSNNLAAVSGTYWPYIESGQMAAMLIGAKGAAGYEILSGDPGKAAASMDAQSLTHAYLAILVVVANIVYLINKTQGGK